MIPDAAKKNYTAPLFRRAPRAACVIFLRSPQAAAPTFQRGRESTQNRTSRRTRRQPTKLSLSVRGGSTPASAGKPSSNANIPQLHKRPVGRVRLAEYGGQH